MDCNEKVQKIKYNAELLANQVRLEKQLSMVNAEIKKTSEELLKLFDESKTLESKVIEILKQNL